jgi:hypothetical protein
MASPAADQEYWRVLNESPNSGKTTPTPAQHRHSGLPLFVRLSEGGTMKSTSAAVCGPNAFLLSLGVASVALALSLPANALEEQAGEAEALKSCEERVCTMLLRKDPRGEDLRCELSKTWAKSTIKAAESRTLKWAFGDARCSVQLHVERAAVVAAMTKAEYTFEVAPHTVHCVVEQDGVSRTVKAKLAPKIVFKNGRAEKVWVNLKSVHGPPAITATLWAAAQLSDGIGLFHRPMIKSVNRFIEKHCPSRYPAAIASSPAATAQQVAKSGKDAARARAPSQKRTGAE